MKKKFLTLALAALCAGALTAGLAGCKENGSTAAEYVRGIDKIELAENGDFIVTYTDGTTQDVGKVTAPKGDKGDTGAQGEQGLKGDKGDTGARGEQGPAGADGKDGRDGVDGKDGQDGTNGIDGQNGRDGVDGEDGQDGRGIQSVDYVAKTGLTYFDFTMTDATHEYALASVDEQALDELAETSISGKASWFGTSAIIGSINNRYYRNDKNYYQGSASVEPYLKSVFTYSATGEGTEEDPLVETIGVSTTSQLARVSYTGPMTMFNWALAYSEYKEAVARGYVASDVVAVTKDTNNLTELEKFDKLFEQAVAHIDAEDVLEWDSTFNTKSGGSGLTFMSKGLALASGASLLGYATSKAEKMSKLCKYVHDNVDTAFWPTTLGGVSYVTSFMTVCSQFSWYDVSNNIATYDTAAEYEALASWTPANVQLASSYGIDLSNVDSHKWSNFLISIMADGKFSAAERDAWAYYRDMKLGGHPGYYSSDSRVIGKVN